MANGKPEMSSNVRLGRASSGWPELGFLLGRRHLGDGHVERPGNHLPREGLPVVQDEAKVEGWVAPGQPGHRLGDGHVQCERTGPDPERSSLQPLHAANLGENLVHAPEQGSRSGEDDLAKRRRRYTLPATVEELDPERCLDPANALAEGRLADVERLGGLGEVPEATEGGDVLDLANVEKHETS
jgi:hypothetical protein